MDIKLPFYAKLTVLLICLVIICWILFITQGIVVPLVFAVIIAIMLHPVVNFFVRLRMNRIVAIIITLLLALLVIAGVGAFLFSQINNFSETWPKLVDKFTEILNKAIIWISGYLNIDQKRIIDWLAKTKTEFLNSSSAAIGQTLVIVGSGLVILLLVPVYIFMLLFYHPLLIEFIRRLFALNYQGVVNKIITEIKSVVQRYLIGLIVEIVLVSILNSVVLIILGIPYAILLGVIGALLNVIPYLGGITAVALPMMIALATKSSTWFAVYVLIGYYIVQLIDNNYIVPKIVASKVKINALVAIVVVIAGNALWGIAGMFLALPLNAIVKLIFDHIEPLKPWGYLLGDTMPPILKIKKRFNLFAKKKN
jgi:predicted PurR-regulated permease PerM